MNEGVRRFYTEHTFHNISTLQHPAQRAKMHSLHTHIMGVVGGGVGTPNEASHGEAPSPSFKPCRKYADFFFFLSEKVTLPYTGEQKLPLF